MTNTAYIAMGGNQGDVQETFRLAIKALSGLDGIEVCEVSSTFQTTAVGANAGDSYINAAARIECALAPLQLLDELQRIENRLGRTRTLHWGPRTLDLDIVGLVDQIINTDRLIVPHPACWYRRFVIDPLCQIAPNWTHPLLQETISEIQMRSKERPLPIEIKNNTSPLLSKAIHKVTQNYDAALNGSRPPAIILSSFPDPAIPRCVNFGDESLLTEESAVIAISQLMTAMFDEPVQTT